MVDKLITIHDASYTGNASYSWYWWLSKPRFLDPGGYIFVVFVDEFVDEKYTNSQRKTWDNLLNRNYSNQGVFTTYDLWDDPPNSKLFSS